MTATPALVLVLVAAVAACQTTPCGVSTRQDSFSASLVRANPGSGAAIGASFQTSENGPREGPREGAIPQWQVTVTALPPTAYLAIMGQSRPEPFATLPRLGASIQEAVRLPASTFTEMYETLIAGGGRLVLFAAPGVELAAGPINGGTNPEMITACVD